MERCIWILSKSTRRGTRNGHTCHQWINQGALILRFQSTSLNRSMCSEVSIIFLWALSSDTMWLVTSGSRFARCQRLALCIRVCWWKMIDLLWLMFFLSCFHPFLFWNSITLLYNNRKKKDVQKGHYCWRSPRYQAPDANQGSQSWGRDG